MTTRIYLIYARDVENESLDLAVEASSVAEAEKLWREWVVDDLGREVDERDFAIYVLGPLTGTPHALQWDTGAVNVKDARR